MACIWTFTLGSCSIGAAMRNPGAMVSSELTVLVYREYPPRATSAAADQAPAVERIVSISETRGSQLKVRLNLASEMTQGYLKKLTM